MSGWFSIHRQIFDCPLFKNEPFSKMQAWIYLIGNANHEDNEIFIGYEKVTIGRGQLHTSIEKLAKVWKWDRKKVMRFLDVLELEQMLSQNRTPNGTTLTIVNYDKFQTNGTTDGTPNGTPNGTPDGTQTIMNNNENKKSKVHKEPDELDKSFKELLDHYASFSGKRSGSTRAKQKYRLLITKGCVVGGEFIKLTPEQIDEYVGNYVNDMVNKKERGEWTPEWRNIDTVLNNITEYM